MNCIVNAKPMNKNSSPIIMTKEYTKQKIQGLQYIRSIPTITEQISEIEAELNAIKQIKNKDPVKKAQIKDWIKVLTAEKKKILSNERKQNKALENMHDLFDENKQLKEQLRKLRKEKKDTITKLKNAKINQILDFKHKRTELIDKLKSTKKQLDVTIKSNPHVITLKEAREKKKFEKLVENKVITMRMLSMNTQKQNLRLRKNLQSGLFVKN